MDIKNKIFLFPMILFIFFAISTALFAQDKNTSKSSSKIKSDLPETGRQVNRKIGFADFLTIYHSYSSSKAEEERLKEKGNKFQVEMEIEKGRIIELEKRMNSGVLSEAEKAKLRKEIEEAKIKAGRKIQEFNVEIENDRMQTIEQLIGELKEKISHYAKEKDYLMILDMTQLIFSDTELELTKEIIDYINKE